jgi:pyruvate/2-oxoglutarate dehydrogenase complex dihydrolipoamide dehydrogenase (E3) component/uncharacterized membrane protein YdjX (TVP38/TMEM64 family)
MFDYDVVVIGAGSAGLVACKLANGLGRKTALIEKRKIGGDCTWFGCIPSKTLIKSAYIAHQLTRLEQFGLRPANLINVNADGVMAHVRSVVEADAAGHPRESYEAEGINVFFGAPKFLDAHRISLDGRTISSNKFIVCTGSSPVIPPIQGLDRIPYLTNETIFNLQTLPKSMLVLGAGPIGIELAAAMNRLGVDVTVLLRSQQILKKDDRELVDRLAQILRAEGVKIRTGTRTKTFTRVNGKVLVDVEDQQGRHQIETDRVLIAVGRKPNIDDLALEKAGVEFDKEGIKVDKRLTTTAPTIYACGDVVPPYLFTHVAEYEAVVAATNACLPVPIRKTNYENVLWCTYTDPELAHAGLTEQQARELYGDKIKIYRWEHKDVDRARTDLAENGLSKFICDKKGKLLGVHILGHGAAELMHEAQLAKSLHLPFSKIASVIHAYPSYSDAVRQPAKRCYIDVLQDNFFLKLLRALTSRKNRKRITIGLIAVLLILLFLMSGAGSWVGQVAKELLGRVLTWTRELGVWGPVFVAAFYVLACILLVPGSVLTLGAGFLFKLIVGTVTVSVGSTLGACAAFLVGRTVGRNWISRKIAANSKFAAIDDAVGRQGFKIVLLTRLSPVFPFVLLNYAFGLTKVSFAKYALASWIGMLPGTIMYVYFGAGLRSLADAVAGNVETGIAGKIFFWFGMAATVLVTVFVTRLARKALKQAAPKTVQPEAQRGP